MNIIMLVKFFIKNKITIKVQKRKVYVLIFFNHNNDFFKWGKTCTYITAGYSNK